MGDASPTTSLIRKKKGGKIKLEEIRDIIGTTGIKMKAQCIDTERSDMDGHRKKKGKKLARGTLSGSNS